MDWESSRRQRLPSFPPGEGLHHRNGGDRTRSQRTGSEQTHVLLVDVCTPPSCIAGPVRDRSAGLTQEAGRTTVSVTASSHSHPTSSVVHPPVDLVHAKRHGMPLAMYGFVMEGPPLGPVQPLPPGPFRARVVPRRRPHSSHPDPRCPPMTGNSEDSHGTRSAAHFSQRCQAVAGFLPHVAAISVPLHFPGPVPIGCIAWRVLFSAPSH